MLSFFQLVGGLAFLVVGAESLVSGATRIARRTRVSPTVIGLTIVAFGTSLPELFVSVRATSLGSAEIALGNAVGSNIFNVLFILGLAATLTPLAVARQLVRVDVPMMIAVSVLLWVLAADGRIDRTEGALLAAGIVLYTAATVRQSRLGDGRHAAPSAMFGAEPILVSIARVALGLLTLMIGAGWLIRAAVDLAVRVGVSELVVGLTIVAAGTSLPEVATSVVAGFKGERDIAIGNIVGSNIFNLLAVLGSAAVVAPSGLPVPLSALRVDIPVMVLAAAVCYPIVLSGRIIARWEGLLLMTYYACYTTYIVLAARHYPRLDLFARAAVALLLATVVPIAISVWRGSAPARLPSDRAPR